MSPWFPHPLPWYVAGPLIGLIVPVLLLLGNRPFGVSSNLRHVCAAVAPCGIEYFKHDWKRVGLWNLVFLCGIFAGAMLASQLAPPSVVSLSERTVAALKQLGLHDLTGLAPREVFAWGSLFTLKGGVRIFRGRSGGNVPGASVAAAVIRLVLPYFLLGTAFGFVIVESEAVSWFRIQEMFRFDAFHMYGILSTAVLTAAVSVLIIKRLGVRDGEGTPLGFPPKTLGSGVRYLAGGTAFGLGWALTGACPGPIIALIGAGSTVMIVTLLSALAGTWTYGFVRHRLPH